MSFLNPWALLGFATLPIIVAMHLHLERNRRVVVSSMFLWTFLDEKFQGKTPKFIRISWLLLLDLLIAAFLSLALARPVISLPSLGGGPVQQIVLIDDSTSMLAMDGDPDRFTLVQDLVVSMIEEGGMNDEVTVIKIGGTAEVVGSLTDLGARRLANEVRDLTPLGSGVDLRAGLAAAQQHANPELPIEIFVITDAAFEPHEIDDFPLNIHWVFVGFEDNNQAVVDLQLGGLRGGQRELFFRVANFSDEDVVREVEIRADGDPVFTKRISLSPRAVLPQVVNLSGDMASVEVALLGDDLVPQDDTAYIGTNDDTVVDVAVVAAEPFPIDKAVSSIPNAELTIFTPEEYFSDMDFDLVVFRGLIPDRWPQGTNLVFDPPLENSVIPVLGAEPVDAISTVKPTPVLEGVDLTGVRWDIAARLDPQTIFEVLVSAGDLPILVHAGEEASDVFVFTPQLGGGNFTKHPAFPILLANLVANSRPFSPEPVYQLGEGLEIDKIGSAQDLLITLPGGDKARDVAASDFRLTDPGLYQVSWRDKYGESIEVSFGVNQGHLAESDIAPRDWRTEHITGDLETGTSGQVIDIPLAPWLLVIVIALLVLEAWRAWR